MPNLIKKRSEEIHKSLGRVSQETGLNRQYLAKLANGGIPDPRVSTALAVANSLRCQVEDLWPGAARKPGGVQG